MSFERLGSLDAYLETLDRATRSALAKAAADPSVLTYQAGIQLSSEPDSISTREGLFALAAAAVMGGEPGKALPVATMSALWWTGMRFSILDATRLAQHHLQKTLAPADRKLLWANDVSDCAISAGRAARSMSRRHFTEISRQNVLSDLMGSFGAAYSRDAVMTARLFAPQAIEHWRRYGLFHGLLRKLTLDEKSSTVVDTSAAELIVPDLLVAHAFAHVRPPIRVALARLRAGVVLNRDLQGALRGHLRSPVITRAYHADLRSMHRRACLMLADIDPGTQFGHVLRSELDLVVLNAGAADGRGAAER
ncbi:hypothetical protein JNUCC0626_48085 [Lentzea sp. JNUCC 0626]|uniref:hypothetical protein n=1 Tax=Lentzea sp. JNUCC 0626 TaxID=3367513 RepID=UPI00374960EA